MEHEETLALIAVAAAEPDGLERLMAGDTPESAVVAGHLAGCMTCVAELGAYARTAEQVRDVIVEEPDPSLRERTLAFVLTNGDARPQAVGPAPTTTVADAADTDTPASTPVPMRRPARRLPFAALAGIAAVVVAAVGGFALGGALQQPARIPPQADVAVLEEATRTLARLAAVPDTRTARLAATDGGTATGSLVFSPTTGELAMFAEALAPAPDGAEYDCWVEVAGERRTIGELYPGGTILAWSGTAQDLVGLADGAAFGVTLRLPDGTQRVVLASAG